MRYPDRPLVAATEVLYHFLDGELTTVRRTEIKRHLEACMPCWEAYDFEAELRSVIRKKCQEQVPDDLIDKVRAALATAASDPEVAGPTA